MRTAPIPASADIHPPRVIDAEGAQKLRVAAQLICRSRRPIIIAGVGILAGGVQRRLRRVAELADVPMVLTSDAAESFASPHPLLLGRTGPRPRENVVTALSNADVVLILGMSAEPENQEVDTAIGAAAKIIRFCTADRPCVLESDATVTVRGDLKYMLVCLEKLLVPVRHPSWRREVLRTGQRPSAALLERAEWHGRDRT